MEKNIEDGVNDDIRFDLTGIDADLISVLGDRHERSFYLPCIRFTQKELKQIDNEIEDIDCRLRGELIEDDLEKTFVLRGEKVSLCIESINSDTGLYEITSRGSSFIFDNSGDLYHRVIFPDSQFSGSEILYIGEKMSVCLSQKLGRNCRELSMNVSQYKVVIRALRNGFKVVRGDQIDEIDDWIKDLDKYYIGPEGDREDDLQDCIINKETNQPVRFTMVKSLDET